MALPCGGGRHEAPSRAHRAHIVGLSVRSRGPAGARRDRRPRGGQSRAASGRPTKFGTFGSRRAHWRGLTLAVSRDADGEGGPTRGDHGARHRLHDHAGEARLATFAGDRTERGSLEGSREALRRPARGRRGEVRYRDLRLPSPLGSRRRQELAGVAQLVEREFSKLDVAGSSPVSRSVAQGRLRCCRESSGPGDRAHPAA